MSKNKNIKPAKKKLGVLTPGMGAVSTTFIAGVLAINKGLSKPIGSLSQMDRIRLGKRTEEKNPLIKEFVPLRSMDELEFGGWDIFEDNAYEAATHADVLDRNLLEEVKEEMEAVKPMKAVFDKRYVKKLEGSYVKKGKTKMDLAEQLMDDIENFKKEKDCENVVVIWCGSTESFSEM
ncbi:MAG: inositol-3-phosphate synthase, partial [Flavobacteriales bacterium]